MSFWLDDDDNENDDPWLSGSKEASGTAALTSSHHKNTTKQSQSDTQQYQCTNCGGHESYYDDATGTDVCTSCFTQSQVIASTQQPTETDWEDVMGLAARTIGGHFVQHKTSSQPQQSGYSTDASGNRKVRRRGRVKLEETLDDEYGEAIPLPDLKVCLQGMQCVLQKCVTIVVRDILSKRKTCYASSTSMNHHRDDDSDENDGDSDYYEERQRDDIDVTPPQQILLQTLQSTVKEIWLSYIHAWSIGAEYYGPRYKHVRFSFRDLFLSNYQVSYIVRRYIPHRIIQEEEEREGRLIPDTTRSSCKDVVQDDDEKSIHENEEIVAEDDIDDDGVETIGNVNTQNERPKGNIRKENSRIRCGAIQKVIQQHGAGRKQGFKEEALLIRPSMTMVAAIIYLAITKHGHNSTDIISATAGLTYLDVCDWIQTGKLPLMTAFHRLLSKPLQTKLYAVRGFFSLDPPIHPSQIEIMSSQLCVACRLRLQPKVVEINSNGTNHHKHILLNPAVVQNQKKPKDDAVRQWEMSNLPFVMARLIAMSGLHQDVLDRSLILMGYTIANHSQNALHIPMIISAVQLSRIDELLAIIAIACQLDPQWRNWVYLSPVGASKTIVPWNDGDIRSICSGPSFNQYLSFVNEHVLPDIDSSNNPNYINSKNISLLPPKYVSAMESLSNISRSNPTTIDTEFTSHGNDDDDNIFVIRPCRTLAGACVPNTVEITNRTCKLPVDFITEHYHKKRQGRPEGSKHVVTTNDEQPNHLKKSSKRQRDEAKVQMRKQAKNRKQQFRRTECDEMHTLPNHDFYKSDRYNNDWEVSGDVDIDQMRLIHYLGSVTNMNPYHIHRSMNMLLQPPK